MAKKAKQPNPQEVPRMLPPLDHLTLAQWAAIVAKAEQRYGKETASREES